MADKNEAPAPKIVQVTVDGAKIDAVEGAPLLQAMLDAGLDIPHYCYHPKLTIDGSCRLCQVRIEGIPKLQISCNTQVRDGMVVHTADPEVALTRRGVMELLLMNHPLDCPICDKAGECWLQNYEMRFSSRISRTLEPRRKREKRLDIGERMLLDQERCILCRRCVRFCREISKTGELAIFGIGDRAVLDVYDGRRLDNAYSMNTADICPVGALETKDFHHKLRVWFLEENASVCPGCANGCNIMVSTYRERIWRLLPRRNDAVNDTWMCDAGRLRYKFVNDKNRRLRPQVAGEGGALVEAEWPVALDQAGAALTRLKEKHGGAALGAVVSPHLTNEENFRFGELLRGLGVSQIGMAVRRGDADDFLIKAEKAANARGVRELGLVRGADDGLEKLLGGIEAGEIKGLYLCGGDLLAVVPRERLAGLLDRLELLIVQDFTVDPSLKAQVFLPASSFAEKEGTFTNHAGRVQRIRRAIKPLTDMVDGEIFTQLLNRFDGNQREFGIAQVWSAIAGDGTPLARVEFNQIPPEGAPLPT